MPWWYYDKKDLRNTPSFRDGIDFDVERRYRKEGARFIMQIGTTMGLGHNTIATGIVYYHRFYMLHSFKTCPRYVTASCCLFLAGKVEETPKKCKDIIKVAKGFLSEQKFISFGDDPKEEVMTLERILLQTIKFDLQVDHPYNFLVKYAKCLKGDQAKLQKIVQMAWNFVNDSLSTTLCLQWEPEIIAVALIYLACKLSKFNVVDWQGRTKDHLKWWDMFVKDITMDVLEDICHQVLDLYQKPDSHEGDESPPQLPSSRASSPVPKKAKTAGPSNPVVVAAPLAPISSAPTTPLKPAAPPGNNIPVKVSSNDLPPEPPHKIAKVIGNNVHYPAPYPSTSGYGHPSSGYPGSSVPQQPPPPLPSHSNPHHQPPPPPIPYNTGYSSRSGPPIPTYNAPPPPNPGYHSGMHHGQGPPQGPPPPLSHYPPPMNPNYYQNSHHHRNHRNSNYHYPPH